MVILTKNMGISRFFEVDDVAIPDNYEIQMLINNEMEYIPYSGLREINGQKSLRIKVDGLSTLSDKYGKCIPNMNDVKKLMKDLRGCLKELGSYLLSPDSLVLNIRYILYDRSNDKHRFMYVPGSRNSFKDQLKSLFEEIMRIYDHQDHNGVMYLYDMYSKVLGDNFTPELFLKMDDTDKKELSSEVPLPESEERGIINETILSDIYEVNDETEDKKELDSGRKMHLIVSGVAVFISVVLYILFGVMSFKVNAILAVILIAYLVIDYLRLKEEQEEKEEEASMEPFLKPDLKTAVQPVSCELKKPLIKEEYIETSVLSQNSNTSVSCLVPRNKKQFHEIYLIEGETSVGRQKNMCDYYLSDASVSRVHAIFEKKGDKVLVRDAGSTNGTFVNDRRIGAHEEVEAALGDTVSIAGVQFECV